MPLNYSKWDALELSDDSDIEGHPNVDKKSLIRWKQRDIHEKREARKVKITHLRNQIDLNQVLIARLQTIHQDVQSKGQEYYSSLVEQLQTNPSPDVPPTGANDQPTYDNMILSLLLQVWDEAKEKGVTKDDPKLDEALVNGIMEHIDQLKQQDQENRVELDKEEEEQKKKITSEDIHDGWDSKYVPPKPEPVHALPKKKPVKQTVIETLNPQASTPAPSAPSSAPAAAAEEEEDDDDDEALPELTPSLRQFSKIGLQKYEDSWEFIKNHRDIFVPGATDALLIEAFAAERRGEKRYAKQCVHQGLLLQYCEKLGRDGVSLFFKRMIAEPKRAQPVFIKDVEDTYAHLASRVKISMEEEARNPSGRETIQLMQEDPTKPITFNVPDGPPPADIRLEGPGTENLDIEEVRKALQVRWDVFQSFPRELQDALRVGTLEAVNNVLGDMQVEDAEEVVKMIEAVGILSLSDGGRPRDMTHDEEGEEGDDEEEEEEEGAEA
ncbi:hypothetical protein M422DRAFT_24618 [Sphaerobolus stellatus SS14]|nr:hypothetical protein M422DRAFT_24618 [Sphaerobolus stellatus SS14]